MTEVCRNGHVRTDENTKRSPAGKLRCIDCHRLACRTSYVRRKEAGIQQPKQLEYDLKRFGITPMQYAEMSAGQDNVCAICHEPCSTGRRLAVDHNHDTDVVRALLCYRCNAGLGMFLDDPTRLLDAFAYLVSHEMEALI